MIPLKLFLFLIIIFLALIVAMIAIIGMGYLLAMIFPLTLFQAATISMGTTLVIAIAGVGIALCMYLGGITRFLKEGYEEDDEAYDEFDDEMEENLHRFDKGIQIVNPVKTGRNTPCPCGSGKKYKLCCGKN